MASYEHNEKSRTWSVRFRLIEKGFEKNKRLSGFPTKKAAEDAYHDFMIEYKMRNGEADRETAMTMTFAQLVHLYLTDIKTRLKASTVHTKEHALKKHLLPKFGNKPVNMITPYEATLYFNSLPSKQNSIKIYYHTFACVLGYGEKMFDLPNISRKIILSTKDDKVEMRIWTPEQYRAFEDLLPQEIWKLYFRTLYIGGLRKGEACALTWGDIHDDGIQVKKTYSMGKITEPKTKTSVRFVSMPKDYIERLRAIRGKAKDTDLIFFAYAFYHEPYVVLDKYSALAHVPSIRVHDLRHSCASLLLSKGLSIVAVSKRLGHSNVTTTLNTYAHLMPREQDILSDVFEGF